MKIQLTCFIDVAHSRSKSEFEMACSGNRPTKKQALPLDFTTGMSPNTLHCLVLDVLLFVIGWIAVALDCCRISTVLSVEIEKAAPLVQTNPEFEYYLMRP